MSPLKRQGTKEHQGKQSNEIWGGLEVLPACAVGCWALFGILGSKKRQHENPVPAGRDERSHGPAKYCLIFTLHNYISLGRLGWRNAAWVTQERALGPYLLMGVGV